MKTIALAALLVAAVTNVSGNAPADRYFGKLQMSALRIRYEILQLRPRYETHKLLPEEAKSIWRFSTKTRSTRGRRVIRTMRGSLPRDTCWRSCMRSSPVPTRAIAPCERSRTSKHTSRRPRMRKRQRPPCTGVFRFVPILHGLSRCAQLEPRRRRSRRRHRRSGRPPHRRRHPRARRLHRRRLPSG